MSQFFTIILPSIIIIIACLLIWGLVIIPAILDYLERITRR